jgi:hypothetical protein
MNNQIFQQYVVELGWDINSNQFAKFNEVLRQTGRAVSELTSGLASEFILAGTAVTGALVSMAGATIGLIDHVAQSDLQFQIYARRMFASTDAAKQMKIATDALGVSLGDILWGPPELRERYQQLIKDQGVLNRGLGGESFEEQMRHIRDIRFEFTRMTIAGQYLAMSLVKNLSMALFGDENGILRKLREFNDWFETNIPTISAAISKYLVPALHDTWSILQDIGDIGKMGLSFVLKIIGEFYNDPGLKTGTVNLDNMGKALDHISGSLKTIFDGLDAIAKAISANPWLSHILGGAAVGAAAGSFIPGIGTLGGAAIGGVLGGMDQAFNEHEYKNAGSAKMMAYLAAQRHGVDPALFMALIERESGWNAHAQNPNSSAYGYGQFIKKNWNMYGMNALDPEQNMDMAAHYLSDLIRNNRGDVSKALRQYGPSPAEQPAYQDYIFKHRERYNEAIGAGAFRPTSGTAGNVSIQVGDTHVHVEKPNASKEEIAAVVRTENERSAKVIMAQFQGVYA